MATSKSKSTKRGGSKGQKVKLANLRPVKDPKGGQMRHGVETNTKTNEMTKCCW